MRGACEGGNPKRITGVGSGRVPFVGTVVVGIEVKMEELMSGGGDGTITTNVRCHQRKNRGGGEHCGVSCLEKGEDRA